MPKRTHSKRFTNRRITSVHKRKGTRGTRRMYKMKGGGMVSDFWDWILGLFGLHNKELFFVGDDGEKTPNAFGNDDNAFIKAN